mmetsp:Transcript_17993/g.32543  ORF Transcript_17993/g.32543 Transcript_17993/m.32543 type:complete len:203 (-) Transcript_17993:949-1557(-)
MRTQVRGINLIPAPNGTLDGPTSIKTEKHVYRKGSDTSTKSEIISPRQELVVAINTSKTLEHANDGSICKRGNTWQRLEIQTHRFNRCCRLRSCTATTVLKGSIPGTNSRLFSSTHATLLSRPGKDHIGCPLQLFNHFLNQSDTENHKKSTAQILVTLTRVAVAPAKDFAMKHVCYIIDKDHNIGSKVMYHVRKLINGSKAK